MDKEPGLQIAFGFTAYPSLSNEMTHEPEYAELSASYMRFGYEDTVGTE